MVLSVYAYVDLVMCTPFSLSGNRKSIAGAGLSVSDLYSLPVPVLCDADRILVIVPAELQIRIIDHIIAIHTVYIVAHFILYILQALAHFQVSGKLHGIYVNVIAASPEAGPAIGLRFISVFIENTQTKPDQLVLPVIPVCIKAKGRSRMIILVDIDLCDLFSVLDKPVKIHVVRSPVVIAVFIQILVGAGGNEFDLASRESAHPSVTGQRYRVHIPSDMERKLIALRLPMDILIGDFQLCFAGMADAVIPPIIVIALLITVKVHNDFVVSISPGFVAHDSDVGNTVFRVIAFRMFAVLNIHAIGSADNSFPAGEHSAIPLPVVVLPDFADVKIPLALCD